MHKMLRIEEQVKELEKKVEGKEEGQESSRKVKTLEARVKECE